MHAAVARERLFAKLDDAREHRPAICVVGPPGAGKTTLVASWLDARGIRGIWYQVDPGDADLATFFYYLGQAAKPFTRKRQRLLPLLTPEYLQDVEGFSRRFFRELFARLPHGATLVLDNYQEVLPEQTFHQVVAEAIAEVPPGLAFVAISRRDPPEAYVRLIANENVQLVEWEELKLTMEETRAIASPRAGIADEEIRQLHNLCGGWAAGLTLLLEHKRKHTAGLDPRHADGVDAIFEYFAKEIFDRLPQDTQRFLVGTAFLPRVTAPVAQALTGNAGAGAILEDLYRRHLFTHRRPGDVPTYQYHALFQTFLRARARTLLSGTEERVLASHAGRLLEDNGLIDDAILLYREAGEWESAGRLIRSAAPSLLAQGRGQTLREWIGALPMERAESDPWLVYWLGASLIAVDQQKARLRLEHAFERFESNGDLVGQALAACGVIDTYYFEWSEFGSMPRWIATLERIMSSGPILESRETELHVYSSLIIAMLYAQPGHPLLPKCVERATEMLELDMDVNHRVMAATFLLSYCALACDFERGRRIVAKVEPLLGHAELSPLNQVWWRTRLGYFLWNLTDYEGAARVLDEAEEIDEAHGLVGLRSAKLLMLNYRSLAALGLEDFKTGEDCVRRKEALYNIWRRMGDWHRVWLKIQFELGRGNAKPAFEDAADAVKAANESGMVYIQILSLFAEARGHADFGSHSKVLENLQQAGVLTKDTCLEHIESEIPLTEAYSLLRRGDRERGLPCLARGLAHARQTGYSYHLRWCSTMQVLCAEALAAGIEVDYVREVVKKYRLRPPSNEVEQWPWPVRINTLGGFEIYRNDERLEFSGKVPKKPLMLLKALIAFGGRNVPEERLMDALWPDEEADAARKSLDITVLRLRKLLGSHEAIVVSEELIGLNPQLCWVDVWAFERRIAQTEAAEGEAGLSAAAAAVALYRGNFLPTDTDEPWTVKARERLRVKFVRLVETVAQSDEAAGHWEKAMAHYLKGLEADDLVEAFHLGLMRCYRALGRPAEGITAFRRLRQTLSVVLGIAPSPAAEALAQELREGSAVRYS
ncbi:MAG: BTAD domain-containing putative transcriptional regulator [Pseudomonadota bacterium]